MSDLRPAQKAWETKYFEGYSQAVNDKRATTNRIAAALKALQRAFKELSTELEKLSTTNPAEFEKLLTAKQTMGEFMEEALDELK